MLDVNMHEKLVSLYNCIRFTFKYHSVFHKINLLYICDTCLYLHLQSVFLFMPIYKLVHVLHIFFLNLGLYTDIYL